MIEAAIFDMDGVIIDSESLWRKSEIEVFKSVGVNLTDEMCMQTVGLRIDEAVKYWHKKFPWKDKPLKKIEEEVINRLIESVKKESQPVKGTAELIEFFKDKKIKTALASSSHRVIIETVLGKFNMEKDFEVINSAETLQHGKPHPEIYLDTAKKLGVNPSDCLAIEDSVNGMLSAKAAGMKTVVIPEEPNRNDKRFKQADIMLNSLTDFTEEIFDKLNK